MRITLYTITDCQFSKAEKEYLTAHNLPFEEKNLEQNREWLSEMLTISNNFAGTPVTKIEKDDGQIVIVKGYNKEELDNILGLTNQNVAAVNSTVDVPSQPQPTPPPPPQPPQPPPPTPTQQPPVTETPTASTNDPLNSVLTNLQEKAQPPEPTQPPQTNQPPTSSQPPVNLPNIPDFNDKT